jgi:hypothetical protein
MTNTIIYITDSEGNKVPAEVRSAVPESLLVCIYRDYRTARLVSVAFEWQKDTSSWRSSDGFSCDFEVASLPREEVSVRIP